MGRAAGRARPGPRLSGLAGGTALAALAAGLACLLAVGGFGRTYYIAVFLPVFMLVYLLVAWLLYLRDDRFMGSPSRMRGGQEGKAGSTDDAGPGPSAPGSAASPGDRERIALLRSAARWEEGPIERRVEESGARLALARRAFAWAALELALASSLLYSVWGVGRVYYS